MSGTVPDRPIRGSERRGAGERRNVRGDATRQLILTTAERLFAERGLTAVPLRDIGAAAGQRNHAAVQYHFGDRDELVQAIMESRGAESEASRAEVVSALVLSSRTPAVRDVVDAFVRPLAIHIRPNNHYLAFLSVLITERGGYEGLHGVSAGASVLTLASVVHRLVAHIPPVVLDERWSLTMTSAVHALARYQTAQRMRPNAVADIGVLIDDLVGFLAAGLVADVAPGDPRG